MAALLAVALSIALGGGTAWSTTPAAASPPSPAPASMPVAAFAAPVQAAATAAGVCRSGTETPPRSASKAAQLITVEAPSPDSTWAALELWQRHGACFSPAGGPWPARIGRNGLSAHHVEDDGTTPTGTFGIGPVMYGIGPDPGVAYSWHHLVCGDWWDEDSASPEYNEFVHVPCGEQPPFGGDSEALWTEAPFYDALALIEYNTDPAIPGRGSAIFLHDDTSAPTTGCVALAPAALTTTLRWLRPAEHPLIVIGVAPRSAAELTQLRQASYAPAKTTPG